MTPLIDSAQSVTGTQRVFARWLRLENGDDAHLAGELAALLQGAGRWHGQRVYVKPNFTAPVYRPGVTTSPRVLAALVEALCRIEARPVIIESDGSLNSWTADEAFDSHGVRDLERRFGVVAVNLTREATVRTNLLGRRRRQISIELPRRLMNEPGILFSVPVLKTHAFTMITLGLKNLWGCIPSPQRLLYHSVLPDVLSGLLSLWGPGWSLIDGSWAMDGFGPIHGNVFPLHVLLLSSPILAGDVLASRFMGVEVESASHLRYALTQHGMPRVENDPEMICPVGAMRTFRPRGDLLQHLAQIVFHSQALSRLVYLSPLAHLKSRLVRAVRGPLF
jgi:uncharacterized protein (DUF362 family)